MANGNDAMTAVSRGEADAAVEVKLLANLRINGDNDGQLRSVAEVEDLPAHFRFAASGRAARLVPLINDVLADIPEAERLRMLRRWVALDLRPAFPWKRHLPALLSGGAGLLLLGAASVWWMRRLRLESLARRQSEEQLRDVSANLPCMAFRMIIEPGGGLRSAFYSEGAQGVLGFVPDTKEALQRWQQGGVGTLITDLNMHGMQGEELIAHIREAEPADAPHTRIVVCSGNPVPNQTGLSRPLYDAYLIKPVDVGVLTETLRAFGLQAAEPATA